MKKYHSTYDLERNGFKLPINRILNVDVDILCLLYGAKTVNMTTIAGIFPAGGNSKFGLICDAITMWIFAVPAGFLAVFYWNLPVVIVFLIINLDEVVKLPASIIHYRKYGWLKNITR